MPLPIVGLANYHGRLGSPVSEYRAARTAGGFLSDVDPVPARTDRFVLAPDGLDDVSARQEDQALPVLVPYQCLRRHH